MPNMTERNPFEAVQIAPIAVIEMIVLDTCVYNSLIICMSSGLMLDGRYAFIPRIIKALSSVVRPIRFKNKRTKSRFNCYVSFRRFL